MNILVLESDAPDYASHLEGLSHDVTYARNPAEVSTVHDVLLARPDYAVEYIHKYGEPQWIQSTWAGITPLVGVARSALVTGVKGIFGPLMSEYVFAYLLEDIRDIPRSYTQQTAQHWQPYLPQTLQNRNMVIVGTGSIGEHIATTARSFNMRVTGVSRTGQPNAAFDHTTDTSELNSVVNDADYLILVLPDTPSTRGLIGSSTLDSLPSHAMLINVGRGHSLDHVALTKALESGALRRAVLDVFPEEPLPQESDLWTIPNITITPHISAVSFPADVAKIFRKNLESYEHGREMDFVVDLAQGY